MEYRLDYCRLLVKDFRACFRFYRDVMEFKPTFGNEDDVYADFATGTVTLALFDRKIMSEAVGSSQLPFEAAAQDKVCLVFGVEDVDAAWVELKSKGAETVGDLSDHPDWGIRTAFLRDPDGNLIEINQPLKQS